MYDGNSLKDMNTMSEACMSKHILVKKTASAEVLHICKLGKNK